MNIFRMTADMLHLLGICILGHKIYKSRNCIGISCKTQEIYLLVFCMRYIDLFMYFISLYNTCMKLFFISSTAGLIYLMKKKKPFCTTYDVLADDFKHWLILLPSALVLTLMCNSGWDSWEMVWSFSLWLESIAFIPQIIMLNKIGVVENLTSHYVACLGLYRFFYILNWVYKYMQDEELCMT